MTAPYGSVDSYAQILRRVLRRVENVDSCALAIVQVIALDKDLGDYVKVDRIMNLVAAVDLIDGEPAPLGDPSGLGYSRPADDPQPVAGREPMHTGAVTNSGLVDETERESIHFDQPDGESFCGLAPTTPHRADEWAKVTCVECLEAVPF